jgi:hypothetical protein
MTLPSSCSLTVSDAVVHAAYNSDEDARKVFDFLGSQPATPAAGPSAVAVTALIDEAWKAGSSWEVGNPQSEERAALFDKLASALSTLAPSAAPSVTDETVDRMFEELGMTPDDERSETGPSITRQDMHDALTAALAPSAEAAKPVARQELIERLQESAIFLDQMSGVAKHQIAGYVRDAVAALSQPQGELREALARGCYMMSEPHLSGYRLIIGFDTLPAVQDAMQAVAAALAGRTAG